MKISEKITMEGYRAIVRPSVTIALTGAFIYGFVADKVDTQAFLTIFGVIITFWFKSREDKNASS